MRRYGELDRYKAYNLRLLKSPTENQPRGFDCKTWDIYTFAALLVFTVTGPSPDGTVLRPTCDPINFESGDYSYDLHKKVGRRPLLFVSRIRRGDHDMIWSGTTDKWSELVSGNGDSHAG